MSQDICVQRWAYAFYSLNNLYDFFMKKKCKSVLITQNTSQSLKLNEINI